MAANSQRFLVDGEQVINDCVINVMRFVPAQQLGANSRVAAKYWGTITYPDGRVESLGDNGKTTRQIKAMIGLESEQRGEPKELRELKKTRELLASLSLDTTEVDGVIESMQIAYDVMLRAKEERKRANSPEMSALRKKLAELQKSRELFIEHGMSVLALDEKIEEINNQINS